MTAKNPTSPGRASASGLALYHFEGCPYCTKVRRAAARLGVALELRDVREEPAHRAELTAARGRPRVPVLRIEDGEGVTWLPESDAIVEWLHRRAGVERAVGVTGAERLLLLAPWVFLGGGLLLEGPVRALLLLGAVLSLAVHALGARR